MEHDGKTTGPLLVSACLLGKPCRYDGASVPCAKLVGLAQTHAVVPVCPEQLGGLPTPRIPSEIQADGRVLDREGVERTAAFQAGAAAAVALACERGCTHAILKANSPSCGSSTVYDGTFSGRIIAGEGIAAAALRRAGVFVQDETEYEKGSANPPLV